MPLDEWQEVVLEAAMGERANGQWASKFVGVSAPRQNGKSQLIVARALAGVLLFGEKMIIISAHETDTAREVWKRLTDVIEDNPTLEARVTGRMDAINREFVSFGEGLDKQTIKLKARRKSGSRGFSADCLLLDEGQILAKAAWGSILPTVSARSKVTPGGPQIWLFGTPPTEDDDPFAFTRVRDSSIAKKARHCWVEWSADKGDDPSSEATWAKANPSYGVRVTRDAVADEFANMDADQFALERLGMWRPEDALRERAVDADLWSHRTDPRPSDGWPLAAVGLDMDDSGRLWVCVAAHADAPAVHVELLPDDLLKGGVDAAVQWLWTRCRRRRPVVMPADSGATVLAAPLLAKGCKVYQLNAREMVNASDGLNLSLKDGDVSHLDDPVLALAVKGSAWLETRSGKRLGRTGEHEGAPLLAFAAARFGAVKWSKRTSGSQGREAVIL